VLRNRTTKETYLVVLFTLYLKEDVNEDGSIKPTAEPHKAEILAKTAHDDYDHDNEDKKALDAASKKFESMGIEKHQPAAAPNDDVD
jgi:hypothetical protein